MTAAGDTEGTITWLIITGWRSFSDFPADSLLSWAPVMILVTVVEVEVEEVRVVMLVMDRDGMACTGVGSTAAMGPTIWRENDNQSSLVKTLTCSEYVTNLFSCYKNL